MLFLFKKIKIKGLSVLKKLVTYFCCFNKQFYTNMISFLIFIEKFLYTLLILGEGMKNIKANL